MDFRFVGTNIAEDDFEAVSVRTIIRKLFVISEITDFDIEILVFLPLFIQKLLCADQRNAYCVIPVCNRLTLSPNILQ